MLCLHRRGAVRRPLATEDRELGEKDHDGPEHGQRAQDQVGRDDAQDFRVEIGLISARDLHVGDLGDGEFDAGEDEDRADEAGSDVAEWVEGLREVEAALAGTGIAEFGDKGIGAGFKKREAAGDDELRHQEEGVTGRRCAAGKNIQQPVPSRIRPVMRPVL